MASSAIVVVRKHGKSEGSPWPRGTVGLVSSLSTFLLIFKRTPWTVVVPDVAFSFPSPKKFHLSAPFSISWLSWVGCELSESYIHIYCFDFDAVGLSLATTYMHSPKTGKWGWQGRLGLGNIYIISNYVPCDLITDAWMRSKLPWPSF